MSLSSRKVGTNNACVIIPPAVPLYALWDFRSERGENVILRWVREDRLTKRARAALNQKLDRLSQLEFDLAVQTKFLAGPIYKRIYKLVVKADIQLRPLLCRGPHNVEREYTLLLGAVEVGDKLPNGAKEKAEENRQVVIKNPNRRVKHGRIPTNS